MFCWLIMYGAHSLAQDSTLTLTNRMFGADQAINLSVVPGWLFKSGHILDGAKPDINTTGWTNRGPSTLSIKDANKNGYVEAWFRLKVRLDSTFDKLPIAFENNSSAAVDLYIDGQLLVSFGQTGTDGKPYREQSRRYKAPVVVDLTTRRDHLLALHLVDESSPLWPNQLKLETLGRNKRLLQLLGPQAIVDAQRDGQLFPIFVSFWLAVTLLLTALLWLLSFQDLYEQRIVRLLSIWGTLSTLANLTMFLYAFDLPFILDIGLWPLSWMLYFLATPFLILALVRILGYAPASLLKGFVITIAIAGGGLGFYTGTFASGSYANLLQFFIFLYWLIPSWKNVQGALWVLVAGAFLTILFDLTFTVAPVLKSVDWFLVITGAKLSLPLGFILYIALRFKEILAEDRLKAAAVVQINEEKRQLLATQNERLEQQVAIRTAELKASQAQLIQKEKLASLGELTAGIAHEIQNPLNFVNNFSDVSQELMIELRAEVAKGDLDEVKAIAQDVQQNLHKIHQHGERASRIVKGMLEHSRASTGERQLTDVNALVDEYLRLAYQGQRVKDKNFTCELVTDLDPALGQVNLVPQEMGRVLLNLYNNAFYAIWERAKQGIDGEYEPKIEVLTKQENGQVVIQVQDNGGGIPEPVKAKIFQPFFTTKPPGEGTGLGLSLSYDMVTKGHGGSLTVSSQVGAGSTFTIHLPQRN